MVNVSAECPERAFLVKACLTKGLQGARTLGKWFPGRCLTVSYIAKRFGFEQSQQEMYRYGRPTWLASGLVPVICEPF